MALRFSIWLLFKIRNFSFRIIDWWEIELEPGLHWRCQIKMRRNFRWCANHVLVWSKNNLLDHLKILLKRSVKMIWRNLWKDRYRKRRSSKRDFHLGWNTFLRRERSFQHLNNDWYYSFFWIWIIKVGMNKPLFWQDRWNWIRFRLSNCFLPEIPEIFKLLLLSKLIRNPLRIYGLILLTFCMFSLHLKSILFQFVILQMLPLFVPRCFVLCVFSEGDWRCQRKVFCLMSWDRDCFSFPWVSSMWGSVLVLWRRWETVWWGWFLSHLYRRQRRVLDSEWVLLCWLFLWLQFPFIYIFYIELNGIFYDWGIRWWKDRWLFFIWDSLRCFWCSICCGLWRLVLGRLLLRRRRARSRGDLRRLRIRSILWFHRSS